MNKKWDVTEYHSTFKGSDQPHVTAALSKTNCPGTHFMGSLVGPRTSLENAMSAFVIVIEPWLLSMVTTLTELSMLHDNRFF